MEVKPTSNALDSTTLVLAYKIGQILSPNHVDQVLRGLPADGSPSLRTGEGFNCRTWVKDALMTLHNDCLLDLSADIGEFRRLFLLHQLDGLLSCLFKILSKDEPLLLQLP